MHKSFSDSNSSSPYSVSEARDLDVEKKKKKKDGKLEVEARKARGQVRRGWNRSRLEAAAWRSGVGERIFHFIWSRF